MATFPALVPTNAPITPGAWPVTAAISLNGAESRIRHGSAEIGRRLRLTFANITEADFLAILSHYRGQRSGFDSFGFTATTLAADRTPSGYAWLYAGVPQVVDDHADCFTVTCEFRCEPRGLVVAPGKAFGGGVTVLTLGNRIVAASETTGQSWVTSSTTLSTYDNSEWTVAASRLLLLLDGSNGSTTFTDSSSNNYTVTATGTTSISTAEFFQGGASASFGGNAYLSATVTGGLGSTFKLRFWFYKTADSGFLFNSRTSGTGSDGIDIRHDLRITTAGVVLYGGTTLALNTWHKVEITLASSTLTIIANGTQLQQGTVSLTPTGTDFKIGGSPHGNVGYLSGYMDMVQLL